jgi:hypothetical protein
MGIDVLLGAFLEGRHLGRLGASTLDLPLRPRRLLLRGGSAPSRISMRSRSALSRALASGMSFTGPRPITFGLLSI